MSGRVPVEGVTASVPLIRVWHHALIGVTPDDSMPEAITAICRVTFRFGDGLRRSKSVRAKTSFRTATGWPRAEPASRTEVAAAVSSTAHAAAVMVCRHGIPLRTFGAVTVRQDGTHSPVWTVEVTDEDLYVHRQAPL